MLVSRHRTCAYGSRQIGVRSEIAAGIERTTIVACEVAKPLSKTYDVSLIVNETNAVGEPHRDAIDLLESR